MESYWIEEGEKTFLACAFQLVMAGQKDKIDETCPHFVEPAILSNVTYFSTILIVLAGIVLQISDENIKFWKDKWRYCRRKETYDRNVHNSNSSKLTSNT